MLLMRLAVLSDVHGNLDALDAVLDDIAGQRADQVISLGDNIGYGAEPEAVINRLKEQDIPTICGNHELAVIDPSVRRWFNPVAKQSIDYTANCLTEAAIAYLHRLPTSRSIAACWFVHGFPPDSPTIYLFQVDDDGMKESLAAIDSSVCFVGHTHELERISLSASGVSRHPLPRGDHLLDAGCRHIINIGSVGQPRDGNRDAKYVVYDADAGILDVRYIPYDREAAARKIRDAGLPESHAARLL